MNKITIKCNEYLQCVENEEKYFNYIKETLNKDELVVKDILNNILNIIN